MSVFPSYSTGTVSIAANGTVVTGVGTNWTGVNAMPGDILQVGAFQTVVSDVTSSTALAIPTWGGGAQSGAAYKIWKTSPLRFAGGQAAADVSALIAALNTKGFFVFVGPDEAAPDPSYGDEGQFALKPSTFQIWQMTGGAWVLYGTFRGFGTPAAYDNGATYELLDVVTIDGSSYIYINAAPSAGHAPPNATYWAVLALKGTDGLQGPAGPVGGVRMAYNATTADADPGNGVFRLNNATPASATAAYLDNLDAGGATVSGIWDTFDDSTSPTRGFVRFEKSSDPTKWAVYRVTGAVVDGTGYRKLTLASGIASVSSFTAADVFSITFYRTGDAGAAGAGGDMLAANNLSDVASAQAARANLGIVFHPQGRLTLASGTPIMGSNQTGKTTLFYTPFLGNQAPIYDGAKFVPTVFAELSIATTDTAKNPAAIGASKVNDWFVWNDAGTIRLSHGPDWTSDTARSAGTGLVNVNGIWLNNVSITNGPAAQRGTYVGTTRSNGSSQLDWALGGAGAGGVAAVLAVWNAYNRVDFSAQVEDTFTSAAVTANTTGSLNGSTSNRISYVVGLIAESIHAFASGAGLAVSGGFIAVGVGHDSTSVISGLVQPSAVSLLTPLSGDAVFNGELGFHFAQALQAATGQNGTVYGSGIGGNAHSGITLRGRF